MDHTDGRGARPVLGPVARAGGVCLATLSLAGAVWFAVIAWREATIALGFTPAHGFARAVAALILTPAAAAFAVPLVDACLALALGKDRPGTWSRIMAAACAASIVAGFATVLNAVLWPGIAVLAVVATVGYLRGVRRWQPEAQIADRPATVPLILLLLDDDTRQRHDAGERYDARPFARPAPAERKAA